MKEPLAAPRPSIEAWVALAILGAIALLLRLAYVHASEIENPIRADAAEYTRYADNLVDHGTFSKQGDPPGSTKAEGSETRRPDSFRSPGYPAFLALVRWASGKTRTAEALDVVTFVQALLSALLVPLTFWLALHALPLWAAFVAAALVALSPHLVTLPSYLLTETLYATFLLLGLALLAHAFCHGRTAFFLLSGASLAIAGTINEGAAPLPWICAALIAWRGRKFEGKACSCRWRAATLLVLLPLLVQGSWALRNAIVVPEDAPKGSERALATLTHGAYPDFVHGTGEHRYFPYLDDPEQPAISRDASRFLEVFRSRVEERPWRYASWYLFEKPAYLWSWNILQGQGDVYVYPVRRSLYDTLPVANVTRVAMKVIHLPLVLLAAFALFLPATRRHFVPTLLALVLLYATALYTIFAPWPRYAVPLRPELYLVACLGLAWLGELGKKVWLHASTGRSAFSWSRRSRIGRAKPLLPEDGRSR